MAKTRPPANPMLDAWLAGQREMMKWQDNMLGGFRAATGGQDPGAAFTRMRENWELAERQAADWWKTAERMMRTGADPLEPGPDGPDATARMTLRQMMDPTRFLYAGNDEVNQAIQRLVEGPEFADIGTLERRVLKATREWLALREASTEYRVVTAAAWSKAFETFAREMTADPSLWGKGPRAVLDRWLAIANEELIRTQRTDEFLAAQRKLLRAGVEYRLKERALVELWCETHSMPTRTEIDDLQRIVHDLARRVRALEKQLADVARSGKAAAQSKAPAKAPRKPPAKRPS
jgi:polyhydroxyalkanoate synthase subunit PhaE